MRVVFLACQPFARGGPPLQTAAAALLVCCAAACATPSGDDESAIDRAELTAGCASFAPFDDVSPVAAPWLISGSIGVWATPGGPLGAMGDGYPERDAWLVSQGRRPLALGRVLGVAIAPESVLRVTASGPLDAVSPQGCIRRIDRGMVMPELAIAPSGRWVAYSRYTGDGPTTHVHIAPIDGGARPRRIETALARSDRAVFVDDDRVVIAGAREGELAGLHLVSLANGAVTTLTNRGMRIGGGLPPSFLPPPARHATMHVSGNVLWYDDGLLERRVDLPAEERR